MVTGGRECRGSSHFTHQNKRRKKRWQENHKNVKLITSLPSSAFAFRAVLQVLWVTLKGLLSKSHLQGCKISRQEWRNKRKEKNRKLLVLFFRILKDVEWREGGDIMSLLQSCKLSFSWDTCLKGFSHADPDFSLFASLEEQVTTQKQRATKTKRLPRLSFYIYSPAMHRYMIYSTSSNNLSLYFCQCTVLLKPVYIQPHDDAWLLTL